MRATFFLAALFAVGIIAAAAQEPPANTPPPAAPQAAEPAPAAPAAVIPVAPPPPAVPPTATPPAPAPLPPASYAPLAHVERGDLVFEGVPAPDVVLDARLDRYLQSREATFLDWLPDGSMLIATRFGETEQVHRVAGPLAVREQLTFYPES